MEAQAVIALVISIPIIFFVPFLVWHTVITGLIHIAQEKAQESLSAPMAYAQKI